MNHTLLKRPASPPTSVEHRSIKVKSNMRSPQEILSQLQQPPYNLKLIPPEHDPLHDKHAELDAELRGYIEPMSGWSKYAHYPAANNAKFMSIHDWHLIEKQYPPVSDLLDAIWESGASFEEFRRLSIFHTVYSVEGVDKEQSMNPQYSDGASRAELEATSDAWAASYRGDGAQVLKRILEYYLQCPQNGYHSRHAVILQSSGTGKSRMVSELGKDIIMIPIIIPSSIGLGTPYPPPDMAALRRWLLRPPHDSDLPQVRACSPSQVLYSRYQSLLYGIMVVTLNHLKQVELSWRDKGNSNQSQLSRGPLVDVPMDLQPISRLSRLAREFHSKMMAVKCGRQANVPWEYSDYRNKFYEAVMTCADEFRTRAVLVEGEENSPKQLRSSERGSPVDVESAARELQEYLDHSAASSSRLLLTLVFDEAHPLHRKIEETSDSYYTVLRTAVRCLRAQPFFTLFLSPAGTFQQLAPPRDHDPSMRISQHHLEFFPPITAVPFDAFAEKMAFGSTWTLNKIASTYQIVHLGRALFASRYDSGNDQVKRGIVRYVEAKLFCGVSGKAVARMDVDPADHAAMVLAWLSIRLGLKFVGNTSEERTPEVIQVERHMRICLRVSPANGALVTVSPSEPLLAEAAQRATGPGGILGGNEWRPAAALHQRLHDSYFSLGDRGEVIAALLVTLARDAALRARRHGSIPSLFYVDRHGEDGDTRVIGVVGFLKALLCVEDTALCTLQPRRSPDDAAAATLADAFKDAYIWFNHIVQVTDTEMANPENLITLIARGAAMMCTEKRSSVDLLIPVLFGRELRKENISAILIQVQNSRQYKTGRVHFPLLDAIDPFGLQLFPVAQGTLSETDLLDEGCVEGVVIKPIIRMVFTLASDDASSSVALVPPPAERHHADTFTAYDIWCAGLTEKTFRVVKEDERETYKGLLGRSIRSDNWYELAPMPEDLHAKVENVLRGMHAAAGVELGHRGNFIAEDSEA